MAAYPLSPEVQVVLFAALGFCKAELSKVIDKIPDDKADLKKVLLALESSCADALTQVVTDAHVQ